MCAALISPARYRGFRAHPELVDRNQLVDEAATGGGNQPQFSAVVSEGRGKDTWFLEQIAVEIKRRHHVAGVVCDFRNLSPWVVKGGERLDDRCPPASVLSSPNSLNSSICILVLSLSLLRLQSRVKS